MVDRLIDHCGKVGNLNLFAWLRTPFPLRIGTTEVDAVLKDKMSPLPAKGVDAVVVGLFW